MDVFWGKGIFTLDPRPVKDNWSCIRYATSSVSNDRLKYLHCHILAKEVRSVRLASPSTLGLMCGGFPMNGPRSTSGHDLLNWRMSSTVKSWS